MARKGSRGSVSVTVQGSADIMAALTGIQTGFGEEALQEAALAGGEVVRKEASRLAPRSKGKGHHPDGGHAADHLVIEVASRSGMAEAKVGPDKGGWYLKFAETGTSKQPARSFLRKALDEKREEVDATMAEVLRQLLGRIVK
jgi:HK97 gp10 family phage protein